MQTQASAPGDRGLALTFVLAACGGSAHSSERGREVQLDSSKVRDVFERHHEPLRDQVPQRVRFQGINPDDEIGYFRSAKKSGRTPAPYPGNLIFVVSFCRRARGAARSRRGQREAQDRSHRGCIPSACPECDRSAIFKVGRRKGYEKRLVNSRHSDAASEAVALSLTAVGGPA
jgi:hypothetical protein